MYDACQTLVVEPAPDTTPSELASIVVAIDMWNRHGATRLTLDEIAGAPRVPVVFQDAAAAFHGYYDGDTGMVFVNRGLTDDHERAVTVAHELGHALGLPHVGDPASVMHKANLEIEVSADDSEHVERLWPACSSPATP